MHLRISWFYLLVVFARVIRNAYLKTLSHIGKRQLSRSTTKSIYPSLGLWKTGKIPLTQRVLCGGKSAGRDFRNLSTSTYAIPNIPVMLGSSMCMDDPANKIDGSENYEYMLLYSPDVLVVSERRERVLRACISKYFEIKEESNGPPSLYLVGHKRTVMLKNGARAWDFRNVIRRLARNYTSILQQVTERFLLSRWHPVEYPIVPRLSSALCKSQRMIRIINHW